MKLIKGAGGGGKGGGGTSRTPVEAADSLRSKAYALVLDALAEGEIGGLVDGLKSVYLDGVPLQNADGSYNFQNIQVSTTTGTQSQSYIPGFPGVENEVAVGVEVKQSASVTRTVSNSNLNAVRVRISVPQLTSQDASTGDINGTSVDFAIDLQTAGGGYALQVVDTISGKTTSKYERTYRVPLTGSGPWDIRVRRITADSSSATLQNRTYWESYTEIIDAKLRYPNTALVGIKIDSSQFTSIPTRGYDVKLLKIQVPTNYDPVARTYSGIWDGTFKTAWSDNPAWCFYDLLTSNRYGLGGYVSASQIDKWALYTAGKYCDELVPDGFGGYEPRFTCNLYLQTREAAYKVLRDLASVFRAMTYWASGSVTVVQDAPADPVYLYTPANVVDGLFTYSGSSAKARHTVALVTWIDPSDGYTQKVEYVEDTTGIARYGVISTEVVAVGCTSRGQANRVGRWLLYSEQSESEAVAFKTGLEGAVARPGQIISIADPTRSGNRRGGRVVSGTTTTVTLDSAATGDTTGATISIIQPTGAIEKRTVSTISGTTVTVSSAFSAAPSAGAIWVLESTAIASQLFRVTSAKESDDGTIEINALEHNPSKFASIENGLVLETRSITDLSITPAAPNNIKVSESLYESQAEVRTLVSVSWDSVSTASSYLVSYKVDNGNYIQLPEVTANNAEIRDAIAGTYTIRVIASNALGYSSSAAVVTQEIFGKTLPPANVAGFSLVPVADLAYLTWTKATDLDVLVGGTVRVRHTPNTTGQTWNNAIDILPAMSGNQTSAQAPLLAGTYMAKFYDSSGNASLAPAMIVTSVPQSFALNVVDTLTESPGFTGAKSSVAVIDAAGGLTLDSALTIDAMTGLMDAWEPIDTLGGVAASGTYTFAQSEDLGAVYTSRITAAIEATGYVTTSIIDLRTDLIDAWLDIDGAMADTANVALYMRTTTDNPAGSPVWSDWKPFFVGEYTARAFQFQLRFTSASATQNIAVTALSVTLDMADRVEAFSGIVSGAASYRVNYAQPFRATPAVGITANNLASGDYYAISNNSETGFDIIFRNSAGTAISRTFDVMAKGYGRKL